MVKWTFSHLVPRFLRVATYFAFVALILLFFVSRAVWGSVEKSVLDIGAGIAALGDVAGAAYTIRLNGEPMNVAATTMDETVSQVLDHVEEECRARAGGLAEELEALPAAVKRRLPDLLKGPVGLGIVRKEHGRQGIVACLARDGMRGWSGLAEGLRELSRTGDLSSLGHPRYVAADQRPDGKTHVVTVWSDGPIHASTMFPSEGDVPGVDPESVVRPPGSRRILATSADGAPFGVHLYDTDMPPAAVLDHYDREMPALGWTGLDIVSQHLTNGRAYSRPDVDLMVLANTQDDGHTVVSLLSMPRR